MITDLYPDGKNFVGEAKILSTPMGEIVKTLMDEGEETWCIFKRYGKFRRKRW